MAPLEGEDQMNDDRINGSAAGHTNYGDLSASTNNGFNQVGFNGLPDGPQIYPPNINRKLAVFGLGLIVTGTTSVFIGALANILEAEKQYQIQTYVNTHWVSTVFLFAGISVYLAERYKLEFLQMQSIVFCLVCLPIGLGTLYADALNVKTLTGSDVNANTRIQPVQLTAMIAYGVIDFINSASATFLSVMILRELSRIISAKYNNEHSFRSRMLKGLGICLLIMSCMRIILWSIELFWVRSLGEDGKYMFLHYTVDEPVWMSVFVMAASLNIYVSITGSTAVMYSAAVLTSLGLYPALLYLWLDYRWYSNVKMTELTVHLPKQDSVLAANLMVAMVHLLLIIATIMEHVRLFANVARNSPLLQMRLQLDKQLERMIKLAAALFLMAATAFLFSDIINLMTQAFFRVFYPTEQKMPLQLYAVGIMCLLCLKQRIAIYFLPITFVALLTVMHTCVFHVVAYLYLAYNRYFHTNLCELFHFGSQSCMQKVSTVAAVSHFFEAVLAVLVFGLSCYVLTVITRLLKLHPYKLGSLGLAELKQKQWCELLIAVIGGCQLVCGVVVLFLSMNIWGQDDNIQHSHPLLVIHSIIYRSCLSLALIIYPTAQILFSRQLLFYPLRSLAIIVMCLYRFVEILTQLDYRNIGQDAGIAWSAFSAVEVVSLGCHFTSMSVCILLLHIANNRVPRFDGLPTSNDDVDSASVTEYRDTQSVSVGYSVGGGNSLVPPAKPVQMDARQTLESETYNQGLGS